MAISSKSKNGGYKVRSISLPCRSHPSTKKVEEELVEIKSWEASTKPLSAAEVIHDGLDRLSKVYMCVDDLLDSSSSAQISLSAEHNRKWADILIDGSIKFLDACGTTRDVVSQMKEHVRDLQCAFRRRKGDYSANIEKYIYFRKKMKKGLKGLMASMKRSIDGNDTININSWSEVVAQVDSDQQNYVASVIRVLIEVGEITASIFESLLMYLTAPFSKPSKWSLVSKLIRMKGAVASECHLQYLGKEENELEGLDVALLNLCKDGLLIDKDEKLKAAQRRLEDMEIHIGSIEVGLECMFRRLIGARVSLLNIISR